jgi:nucleoside-diphosphate-sugar epimerase
VQYAAVGVDKAVFDQAGHSAGIMMTDTFPFQTVLITGGAGFIGSRAVGILRERGVKVIVADNGYVGLPLPEASEGVVPVNVDIRNRQEITAVLAAHRPDAILHLAAVHHIPTCEREPHLAFDVNVLGTQALLDGAAEVGIKNVVFASSGAVYRWDNGLLDEAKTLTGATDVYSITKLSNEYQLAGWAARTGSRVHIARLFNTIGTGDPNGHLIPDILEQIGTGEANPVVKLGNTEPKRDYIFVDDSAAGFVALLEGLLEGEAVEYFNLCTGEEMSVAGLVGMMGELMGVDVRIESDPSRFRKIDRLQQLGDATKLKTRRNWAPQWTARRAVASIMRDLGYKVIDTDQAA